MTFEERVEMYKNKKAFIKAISKAFETTFNKSTVDHIDYEVYQRDLGNGSTHYAEFLIVWFYGGGKSVAFANGNSNTANFKVLGNLVGGGYYEDNFDYENTVNSDQYTLINLD